MSKTELIDFLESLVHSRRSILGIQNAINDYLHTHAVVVEKSWQWDNTEFSADYQLIGSTELAHEYNENRPFCDFDIYVLPTKQKFKNGDVAYYITEVGYEFY